MSDSLIETTKQACVITFNCKVIGKRDDPQSQPNEIAAFTCDLGMLNTEALPLRNALQKVNNEVTIAVGGEALVTARNELQGLLYGLLRHSDDFNYWFNHSQGTLIPAELSGSIDETGYGNLNLTLAMLGASEGNTCG